VEFLLVVFLYWRINLYYFNWIRSFRKKYTYPKVRKTVLIIIKFVWLRINKVLHFDPGEWDKVMILFCLYKFPTGVNEKKWGDKKLLLSIIERNIFCNEWNSGFIKRVDSPEWDNSVVFYYLCVTEIWTYKRVSELLLFNVNSAIFHLYHCENKLIFNEIMMRSTLY
jgi:hypothetical protein